MKTRPCVLWLTCLTLLFVESSRAWAQSAACETFCAKQCRQYTLNSDPWERCVFNCEKTALPCLPISAIVYPKYYILALVYSPPGCTSTPRLACGSVSSVDYENSTATGTTLSVQHSFASSNTVTASVDVAPAGINLFSASASGGFSTTSTSGSTETLTKTNGMKLSLAGNRDGVDHDQDQFIILLNPAIGITGLNGQDRWNMGYHGATAETYLLYVSWLKNPASMPPAVSNQLKALNFTAADYATILAQDPFASGPSIDPQRFVPTTYAFPYEPPDRGACNNGVCNCVAFSQSIENELQAEVTAEYENQYTVSLSASFSLPVQATTLGLKDEQDFTWTDTSSSSHTTGSTQSATATVSCPSAAYNGPTEMAVYTDTLYGTFLFVPVVLTPQRIIHRGTVLDVAGKPVRHAAAELTYGGRTYHTFTDQAGAYRFYSAAIKLGPGLSAAAKLSVGGVSRTVTLGSPIPTVVRLSRPLGPATRVRPPARVSAAPPPG